MIKKVNGVHGLGSTPRLHCPGEKSPSTLLLTHLGLLNPCPPKNSAAASISPVPNYVLHLSAAPCGGPCAAATVESIRVMSSHSCPSRAILQLLLCWWTLSHHSADVVGQVDRKREVRQGISNKGTMTSLDELHEEGKNPKNTKTPGAWSFKTKPRELRSLWWHFWVGN